MLQKFCFICISLLVAHTKSSKTTVCGFIIEFRTSFWHERTAAAEAAEQETDVGHLRGTHKINKVQVP